MPGGHAHRTYDDEYMMYSFKVKSCPRTDHHNWKHCPWKHEGEVVAQRRHPSLHKPTFCMNLKMSGECAAGDSCPFSHNTFEMSLHPERYKTTLCNLGEKCNREICFFAHSQKELRSPEPMPLATSDKPAGQGGAAGTVVDFSAGGFTGTADSIAQAGGLPVLYNGQVVELASSSYVNPMPDASTSNTVIVAGLPAINEQQQLQWLQQQQSPAQQPLGGVMMRGLPMGAAQMTTGLSPQQQQQQQQLLQELSHFESFTSQSSLQQPSLTVQQQILQQELGNFESFTSQSSSLPQLTQLGQHSFSSTRQDMANLRGDLTNFDSFSTQSSTRGAQMAALQQMQQQQQQDALLRQDLSTFESFTSQGSRGGLTALQQFQQANDQALLRQDNDSFTSQCSTSSQVLGAGYTSLPVAQGLQVQSAGASFTGVQGSGGSFTGLPGVQASGGSFTSQVHTRLLRPLQATGTQQGAGTLVQGGAMAGPSSVGVTGAGSGGQLLSGVSQMANLGPTYQVAVAPQQQQSGATLQQQVMQLQLQAQELWKLE